jgi:hypothetical protein
VSNSSDPSGVTTDGAITLVLGQRTTSVRGHRLAMHNNVASELRTICQATLTTLSGRTPVPYANDLHFDRDNEYLVVPLDTLVAHKAEDRRGKKASLDEAPRMVEVDPASMKVLTEASSQPMINASEIERRSFLFYAAVVGDDPDDRPAFVSKWNPYRAALSGRLLTSFGDRLRKVEGPLLAFERRFDLVVTTDSVLVLDPEAFEKVFRDIDAMRDRIPVWTRAVTDALPVDEATARRIERACQTSARVAKQARSIFERGVGKPFTGPELREEMKRQGLDASRLIKQGKLVLDNDDDVPEVLKLIDEKLYTGWHSGTGWDVGTRSRR